MIRKLYSKIVAAATAGYLTLASTPAPAASNIGDVAKNLNSQTGSILDLLKNGILIAGVCLFAVGVIKAMKSKQEQGSMGDGLKLIIAGVMLGAIGFVMKIGGSSIGADESQFSGGQGWN